MSRDKTKDKPISSASTQDKPNNQPDVFSGYKTGFFTAQYKKDENVDDASKFQNTLEMYLNFIFKGSDITRSYHFEVIKQAQLLLVVFSGLFVLITIYLCVIIAVIIFTDITVADTLVPIIVGAVADLFSGVLILVMQSLIKSRDHYFDKNIESEHFSKIIGLIHTIEKDEDKHPFIEKIINNYCDTKPQDN